MPLEPFYPELKPFLPLLLLLHYRRERGASASRIIPTQNGLQPRALAVVPVLAAAFLVVILRAAEDLLLHSVD